MGRVQELNHEVSQEQLIIPLARVIQDATPKPSPTQSLKDKSASISQTLDELFPEQERYAKEIKIAKQALGLVTFELTPEQLKDVVTEVQYLCESWLDDFERTVFNGLTLKELLHEKGAK